MVECHAVATFLDDGVFVVLLEIAAVDDSSISFFRSGERIVEYLGDRYESSARVLFQTIEEVRVLDDISIYGSWCDPGAHDGRQSFCIPIWSERVFLSCFEAFHLPVVGHDDEDPVLEESGFLQLEIEIEEALVCISERVSFRISIRRIIRFVE